MATPETYRIWVAGTARSAAGHGRWPVVGSTLEHSWGPPVLHVRDHTGVTAAHPGHELRMRASARPIACVDIEIRLADVAEGTRVELCETVIGGLALWFPQITVLVQRVRNRRSLRRLIGVASAASTPRR